MNFPAFSSMKFLSVFRRSALMGLAFALFALILIDITAYRSSKEYTETVDVVKRAYRVLTALNGATTDLVSAESEVRGYVITADERYLAMYQTAILDVKEDLSEMERLISDPASLEHFAKFDAFSDARLARLDLTLKEMRSGGIDSVRQVAGPGKDLMDQFRKSSSLIEERQLQLLDQRERKANELSKRSTAVILAGSTFAVILLAVSMFLLGQQLIKRERLECELLEISEREQRHIGQDLHDGVCQELTGISLLSQSLAQKVPIPFAEEAGQITKLINECIEQLRQVTHGLHPVPDDPSGLMQALKELTGRVSSQGKMKCHFICPQPVVAPGQATATSLYRIAQEALQNAMRHAVAQNISVELTSDDQFIHLTVSDDGTGIPEKRTTGGMGLEIMAYRASSMGASLDVRRRTAGGTQVSCRLPRNSLH